MQKDKILDIHALEITSYAERQKVNHWMNLSLTLRILKSLFGLAG